MIYLTNGLSFCEVEDSILFLDINNDRYFALDSTASQDFTRLVNTPALSREALHTEFVNALVNRSILTRDEQEGTPLSWPAQRQVRQDDEIVKDVEAVRDRRIGVLSVISAVSAFAQCWYVFRTRSFAQQLQTILRWQKNSRDNSDSEIGRAIAVTRECTEILPLFFSAKDACLFKSLFLIRMLAQRRIQSELVIGVCSSPFSAHCWVEKMGMPLNEDLEVTRQFVRIHSV